MVMRRSTPIRFCRRARKRGVERGRRGDSAVDAVMRGEAQNAFCAVRPPGHHAEPDRAMGFCLFNSIAIAARHAQAAHGIARVAIVDFDVHHGNGTQAVAEQDPPVFFALQATNTRFIPAREQQETASAISSMSPLGPTRGAFFPACVRDSHPAGAGCLSRRSCCLSLPGSMPTGPIRWRGWNWKTKILAG